MSVRAPALPARPALGGRGVELAHRRELVVHLARREVSAMHRWTLLGWAWPLTRQLSQLAVLVFAFSSVLDLGIPHYPVFVFCGLIAWTWFSAGIGAASWSLVTSRHLVFQPRCPSVVIPVVAVAAPFVEVLMALPVLVAMLAFSGLLRWTSLLLPALLAVQLVLMIGLAWLVAAVSVYLRDVPNVVSVALTTMFYVTPVFFALSRVPTRLHWVLGLNPMATLIESYRAVLLGGPFPAVGAFAGAVAGSAALALAGLWCFRRLEPGFVDEL